MLVVAQASPASNGGRGLKQRQTAVMEAGTRASPASNGGRGLKLVSSRLSVTSMTHRPPAMAGAD